ncbi:MAG: Clp protease ClpP [Bacteroidaceae bacterium]|nr:Clp protease ClpP [Bacteroidaceae bacterium]
MIYNINIDDYIGRWGYSKQYIRNELAKLKGKPVNVRISSLGGSVEHGLDIRQQFVDHGEVTAYLYGLVASSATIAALGAKKVCISKYCMFLVHKVSNWVDAWGQMNADQIQELIDDLKENKLQNDKFDLVLAQLYANKCGKQIDDILDTLKAGRWLTAQEALNYGFVDEIIEDAKDDKINLASFSDKLNVLGLPALPQIEQKENKEQNWFQRIMEKLDAFSPATKTENNNHLINLIMKKDYQKVNVILNVEGLEFDKDGKVTLTEDQVKVLNEKLDALEKDASDKQTQVEELTTQVENLKKADGDETKKTEGEENGEFEDIFKVANDLYNSL